MIWSFFFSRFSTAGYEDKHVTDLADEVRRILSLQGELIDWLIDDIFKTRIFWVLLKLI